jgi:two-component system cell cycle response regulator DivK
LATFVIVEDNPDNMKLFRAVLRARGHDVVPLTSGAGLEAALSDSKPDLILLDIQLPGEDGFQILDRLRALGRALPPIVALTAHAMTGDREKALAAGFDGYLTKPIDVATFGASVERMMRESRGSGDRGIEKAR